MRGGRGLGSMMLALCAALILGGCTSAPLSTPSPSAQDHSSIEPTITLAAHNASGVTISVPASWKEQHIDGALQLADPEGDAAITVVVREALKEDSPPSEPGYTASSYLETALPYLMKETGVDVLGSLTGRTRPVDVPGADDAARLEVAGVRAHKPVDCSAVAAQVSPNIAVIIGTDVDAGLWEQIVSSLRVGALDPS